MQMPVGLRAQVPDAETQASEVARQARNRDGTAETEEQSEMRRGSRRTLGGVPIWAHLEKQEHAQ